jgi:hypothetical protein
LKTHDRLVGEKSRASWIVGRATFTTVASIPTIA